MIPTVLSSGGFTRRAVSLGAALLLVHSTTRVRAGAPAASALDERFDYLSTHGNSSCSAEFMESIARMPVTARLQGSCCSPMDRHRYVEQVRSLAKYGALPEIPPDPYDIAAGLAQKLMARYDAPLALGEQQIYQFAMENADEKGPCCCRCWRWKVYGGLAKTLIRDRGFTGEEIVEVWNLSSGCGGGAEHRHG